MAHAHKNGNIHCHLASTGMVNIGLKAKIPQEPYTVGPGMSGHAAPPQPVLPEEQEVAKVVRGGEFEADGQKTRWPQPDKTPPKHPH